MRQSSKDHNNVDSRKANISSPNSKHTKIRKETISSQQKDFKNSSDFNNDEWGFEPFSPSSNSFDRNDPFHVAAFNDFNNGGKNVFKPFANTSHVSHQKSRLSDNANIPELSSNIGHLEMNHDESKSVHFSEITRTKTIESTGILKPPKYNQIEVSKDVDHNVYPSTDNNNDSRGRRRSGLLKNAMGAIRRGKTLFSLYYTILRK